MGSFPKTYNDPDIDTRGKIDTDTPGHWIPDSLSVELGLRIVDYGFRSFVGLLELYSGFQRPRFRDFTANLCWIPESKFHYMGRIPCHQSKSTD